MCLSGVSEYSACELLDCTKTRGKGPLRAPWRASRAENTCLLEMAPAGSRPPRCCLGMAPRPSRRDAGSHSCSLFRLQLYRQYFPRRCRHQRAPRQLGDSLDSGDSCSLTLSASVSHAPAAYSWGGLRWGCLAGEQATYCRLCQVLPLCGE